MRSNKLKFVCPVCHAINVNLSRKGASWHLVREEWTARDGCPYHGKIDKIDSAQPSALSTISEGERNE